MPLGKSLVFGSHSIGIEWERERELCLPIGIELGNGDR
jgi:hypothetical protein